MSVAAKERIRTEIFASDREASRQVARIVAAEIRKANAEGRPAVLGLATGSTPIGVYRQLINGVRRYSLCYRCREPVAADMGNENQYKET